MMLQHGLMTKDAGLGHCPYAFGIPRFLLETRMAKRYQEYALTLPWTPHDDSSCLYTVFEGFCCQRAFPSPVISYDQVSTCCAAMITDQCNQEGEELFTLQDNS